MRENKRSDKEKVIAPLDNTTDNAEHGNNKEGNGTPIYVKYFREAVWWATPLGPLSLDGLRVHARDNMPDSVDRDRILDSFGYSDNPFFFHHVGDWYETAALMLGIRAIYEAVDLVRSRAGYEQADPRFKMWFSTLAAVAIPITIETLGLSVGGNTPEIWYEGIKDSLGPIITGIFAGSAWEIAGFIIDQENWIKGVALSEKYGKRVSEFGQSILDGIDKLNVNTINSMRRVDDGLTRLTTMIDSFGERMKNWNPKLIDTDPEKLLQAMEKRVLNAIFKIHLDSREE